MANTLSVKINISYLIVESTEITYVCYNLALQSIHYSKYISYQCHMFHGYCNHSGTGS